MKTQAKALSALLLGFFLLFLLLTSPINSGRAQTLSETPPTALPTLPVELYSQTATPASDGSVHHVVLEGQFLITIAEMYGIRLDDLLSLNNITVDELILPGRVLMIKRADPFRPTATLAPGATATTPIPTSAYALFGTAVLNPEHSATPTVTATPTPQLGLHERIFSNQARYIAVGIVAMIAFGVLLLVLSARRMS